VDGEWDEHGWSPLGPGVARRTLPGVDVTVGVVAGTAGLLVVDTGGTLAQGAEVARALPRAATHVVLTHGHWDHCFGTPAFAGARVVGHRGLPAALDPEELAADAQRYGVGAEEARAAAEALVGPDVPVPDELTLDLGGPVARVIAPGPAHTACDLAVVVRTAGGGTVVFCGDLVEESGPPQAGPDAVPEGWPAALDRLLAEGGEDARYVPGHGAVVDARFVRAQRDALAARYGVS
jgi:glyoxylase-like metal-dependent hydrolase (beta-lactamase superfamily II)